MVISISSYVIGFEIYLIYNIQFYFFITEYINLDEMKPYSSQMRIYAENCSNAKHHRYTRNDKADVEDIHIHET